MGIEENKEIARRAFEALMGDELSRLSELVTPGAVLHQCGWLHPIPVSALVRGDLPRQGPVRDPKVRLERMIAEGDLVALHWWTTGRHRDRDLEVSFPSMSFARVESGKIAEIWNIQDMSTLDAQLFESGDQEE